MTNQEYQTIIEWIDLNNPEHRAAYEFLWIKAKWPVGFIPENVLFPGGWNIILTSKYADALRAENAELRKALGGLLDMYVGMVNSGDCGFWDPEKEPEVIAARAALKRGEP